MSDPYRRVVPAPLMQARALFDHSLRGLAPFALADQRRRLGWIAAAQLTQSRTAALFHRDQCIAVLGAWPDQTFHEVFLVMPPDKQAAPHLKAIVRAGRLTLAEWSYADDRPFLSRVREGHAPGARLLALIGFTRHSVENRVEIWIRPGGQRTWAQ